MRHLIISFLPILFLPSFLFAEEAIVTKYGYWVGSYVCVGRWPDSDKTFSGRVEITKANEGVKIIRVIDGQRIEGVGKYDDGDNRTAVIKQTSINSNYHLG